LIFFPLAGSAALQFTPVQSITDLVNSEIRDLIHSKAYFKGSSHSLDHVLNNVIHREITLSALGGLIGHLDRLMVHFYTIQWCLSLLRGLALNIIYMRACLLFKLINLLHFLYS